MAFASATTSSSALSLRFAGLRAAGRRALVTYVTAGYPTLGESRELIGALPDAGADVIEIGVPFSDPMADGPTIQASSQRALENGMTLDGALALVADAAPGVPTVLFTYLNPLLAAGPDVLDRVKAAGVGGILVSDLPLGAEHGAGTVVLHDGVKMLQIPLWRSYLAGCILLGVAPCTAMVLVWGYLARGNDALTLVMVAINSLTMLVLYGVLGGFLLGVGRLPVPWQALLLSIAIYVALPLVTGYFTRRWIIAAKGEEWFKEKFLRRLNPIPVAALLLTLVLLFSFKGEVIAGNPLTILWIAIPLFLQTILIFALTYWLAKVLKLTYEDAAHAAMIGASNHFEVAIATAVMLFGLSSGAALATVVGVLIEVPVMLMLVGFCKRTTHWFDRAPGPVESGRN